MGKLGMEEGEPIEHGLISKAIENAQRKVEGRNFEIRKQLLEYDDVLNKQREVIYAQRRMAMTGEGVHDSVLEMMDELAEQVVDAYADDHVPGQRMGRQGPHRRGGQRLRVHSRSWATWKSTTPRA